jgi:hypothetical protein
MKMETSIFSIFEYRRQQDEEDEAFAIANDTWIRNNTRQRARRIRRFKKRPSATVLTNGELFEVTPRSSAWYTMYVEFPAVEDAHFHEKF